MKASTAKNLLQYTKAGKSILDFYWLFILIGLIALSVLFSKSNSYNLDELKKINRGLMHIVTLDVSLDEYVTKNVVGIEYDFDGLASSVDNIEVFSEEFYKQLEGESQGIVFKTWTSYEQKLKLKVKDIEHFKSALAILKNSMTYFIRLVSDFESEIENDLETLHIIDSLKHEILLFYFNESVTDITDIYPLIKKLRLRVVTKEKRGSYPELIQRHTQIIIKNKVKINVLLSKILNGTLQTQLKQISKSYLKHHEKLTQQAKIYQNILFFVVFILGLVIYLTIKKIVSTSSELKDSIVDLNYRKIAEDEHSIVSITDVTGKITFVNDKFIEVSKYSKEELLGQKHNIIKSEYHDDDFFKSMWCTIAQGEIWHGIVKNKAKDGSYYWVDSTIVPFLGDDGKPFQYISMRTDITQQLLIKEQLSESNLFMNSLTNAMGEGVFAIGTDSRCTYFNQKAQELLGWNKSDVLGRELSTFISCLDENGDKIEIDDVVICQSLKLGTIRKSESQLLLCRDNSRFPASIVASPLYEDEDEKKGLESNTAKKLIGVVVVFSDITLHKRMLQGISDAKDKAEEANQMKSDFIANMSHELRTPLNAIIGLNHLVLQTELTKDQHDYLHKADMSSKVLLGLINDVLDMSKIESGKLIIEQRSFNLEKQFSHLYSVMADQADDKNLDIYFSFDPLVPEMIIGDSLRINQVLMNLVSNAIKFTEQGEITIKFGVKSIEHTSKQIDLYFEVIDSGIGITEEQQNKLFQAFTQADNSTSRKYGGTGLGLNISKNLVDLMGGKIGVKSNLSQGSTFYFDILCSFEKTTDLSEKDQIKQVLLIDPEPITNKLLKTMIESFNFNLFQQTELSQPLAAIDENSIDSLFNRFLSETSGERWLILNAKLLLNNEILKFITNFYQSNHSFKKPFCLVVCFSHQHKEIPVFSSTNQTNIFQPITPSVFLNAIYQLNAPIVEISKGQKQKDRLVKSKRSTQDLIKFKGNILLAEDNKINQLVASKLLKNYGLDVSIANNGKEAVKMVQENHYDLVLMDVQMPEMDGIEATITIREQFDKEKLGIIAVTAHALDKEKQRCLDSGMNDHLSKPIIPERLHEILFKWLEPQ